MKTRLIIASIFTVTMTAVAVFTMRSSAVAQEELIEPPRAETTATAPAADAPESEGAAQPADGTVSADGADTDLGESLAASDESAEEAPEGSSEAENPAELLGTEAPEPLVFHIESFEAEDDSAVRHSEESETLSVDFPDEEIRAILRVVADLFDLNLVIPQELVGRASIKLRNVTWRQVFDVVLSPAGFTWVEEANIIKVVSLESLTREPPLTKVIILNYAQADQVVGTVRPLVNETTGGRIQVDKRSNALVITERPTQLRRIESIIADLDKPNVQVMIESKFVETRNRHLENIGINWASLEGWGVRGGPFQHEFLRERNVLQNDTTRGFDSDTSRITTAVFSADQFNILLSALRQNNDVKLVSNPTVVTMNNRPAEIHIGEEFPIVLPRFNPQTGTYEAGEYNTIDIGIKLDVTPQVNNAGFINLAVQPDVSTLADTITYFGAEYPVRSTRRTRSEVTIKDGFTVAMGGLVQDDIVQVQHKVPVLGSIPGVGRLFRSDRKDNDQRNLIIFLTARTLNPDGGTIEDTVDPRQIHRMGLTRDEIPGFRPDIPLWLDEPAPEQTPRASATEPEVSEPAAAEAEAAPVKKDTVVQTGADAPVDATLLGTADVTEAQAETVSPIAIQTEVATPEAPPVESPVPAAQPAKLEFEDSPDASGSGAAAPEEQPAEPRRFRGWLTPSR